MSKIKEVIYKKLQYSLSILLVINVIYIIRLNNDVSMVKDNFETDTNRLVLCNHIA